MIQTWNRTAQGLMAVLVFRPIQRFVVFMDDVDEVWDLDDPLLTDEVHAT